jgi:multiple sugar transport system substrate-binding protein|tara:strand:+ start:37177 stop:38424 length:1248 start_codon:yes stop_codon:yes gene_type:complete
MIKNKKLLLPVSALALALMTSAAAADTKLNALFMSQAAYSEEDVKAMVTTFEENNSGITVELEFVPYEALHDKIITSAAAGDSGYDVVLYDVVWPAEFAEGGFLTDLTSRVPKNVGNKIFDGAWTTVTYNDRIYGMPWILDTKYLFFNRELLAQAGIETPPTTWAEVMEQSRILKDKGVVEYPLVWSWSQSEAMICDYTTLVAANGGHFFKDGKPAFDQGGARAAIDYMVTSLNDGLTNPASTEYFEEDVRRVFSNGEAAFAMNWTYMNALVNDPTESKVAGKVGVMPAPGVEGISTASAVNGSMGLGIPSNSPHQDEAWALISYLTSKNVQENYAKLSLPVWKDSYTVTSVTNGQEELVTAASKAIAVMSPRPVVPAYTEVSNILQKHLHSILLGQESTDDALADAAKRVSRIR